jgi:hypothetical protein
MKFINDTIKIKFKGQDYDVYHCKEDNQLVIGVNKDVTEVADMKEDMERVYALNEYLRMEGFFPQYFETLG